MGLLGLSTWLASSATYIHAKAWLAQHLIASSWAQGGSDGQTEPPWPWADTYPVARLQVPAIGIDQYVLAGDSGRNLAFGPGWSEASAPPTSSGTTVISGHRDTHFSWLEAMRPGVEILIESRARTTRYVVRSTRVANSDQETISLDDSEKLMLVTCYPFDAVDRGPLRFVVEAVVAQPSKPERGLEPNGEAPRLDAPTSAAGAAHEPTNLARPLARHWLIADRQRLE